MIILSAFYFFYHFPYMAYNRQSLIVYCSYIQACGDSLYILLSLTICQRSPAGLLAPNDMALPIRHLATKPRISGNPRAWTSVPGRFPSFPNMLFTETRELQHLQRAHCEPRSSVTNAHLLSFALARSRKEVFQPHLPVRLPCYDLAPITSFALGRSSR